MGTYMPPSNYMMGFDQQQQMPQFSLSNPQQTTNLLLQQMARQAGGDFNQMQQFSMSDKDSFQQMNDSFSSFGFGNNNQ